MRNNFWMRAVCLYIALFLFLLAPVRADENVVLLEAEHFADYGGWSHDSQFIDQMGSSFLLAHGLGNPVTDAVTEISLKPGTWHIWVRTRDWVAPWNAPGSPGRFQLLVDGKALETTFGTEGAAWHWQRGGAVEIVSEKNKIALHDLTGFEGRCDAILFSKDAGFVPTNEPKPLAELRRRLLGFPETPELKGQYDLVVVGGGIAGTCAAVSAARFGLTVALIQDRPVLGGNNSSEVRVWLQGARNLDPLPNIGNVVAELEQKKAAHYGPTNTADLYEDDRKLALVQAEKNISLFLEHRMTDAVTDGNRITGIVAQNTRTGRDYRFDGRWFADCTGDGCLGFAAGADHEMTLDGHMGRCNLWNVLDTGEETAFPGCPWALDLSDKPFPGRKDRSPNKLGGWYWESGFYHDPIEKSEAIRDWNFRAAYGAWDALKNTDKVFGTYKLNWMAHIAGKRESRRLLGDVVLTKQDLLQSERFEDAAVPTGWKIDVHLPEPAYQKGFEGDEFIAVAHFTDYPRPYWIPYRCFYSRNIENLFMAGRDISVTHEALGTSRVMRTGGCMGEVVGMAASLCKKHDTSPRGVYQKHLAELRSLMEQGVEPNPDFSPPKPKALKPTENNVARKAAVTTTSHPETAKLLNDGALDLANNDARWISEKSIMHAVVFTWSEPVHVDTMRIVSGYTSDGSTWSPIVDFVLQKRDGDHWNDVVRVTGNEDVDFVRRFEPVETGALRLVVNATRGDVARIWEIEFYRDSNE